MQNRSDLYILKGKRPVLSAETKLTNAKSVMRKITHNQQVLHRVHRHSTRGERFLKVLSLNMDLVQYTLVSG